MGREEFIKKFKVGSKARLRNWKDSLFVKISNYIQMTVV